MDLGFPWNPEFTPDDLTMMLTGEIVTRYFTQSDEALESDVVPCYLNLLAGLAEVSKSWRLPLRDIIMVALTIMYLADRGFIPNDEFNGAVLVYEQSDV